MPKVEAERIRQLGNDIESKVTPTLEEANELLPELRQIDQALYTSVDLTLAASYTTAVSYMNEMVQGAADCFRTMNENLEGCATGWEDADDGVKSSFK